MPKKTLYFLAKFTIYDGDHEHSAEAIIKATSSDAAQVKAESMAHDTNCWGRDEDEEEDENTCACQRKDATIDHPFSNMDGTTASSFRSLQKISAADVKVLRRLLCTYEVKA